MGSGKYLKHAQEKYGLENFTKDILFVFDTPELMYAKEAEIVNEEFLAEENTYNLKVGVRHPLEQGHKQIAENIVRYIKDHQLTL
jgi:hypothetical protein